jgi:hypothetical protein
MPKILLREKQLTGQFRCTIDGQTLSSLDDAVVAAKRAGLVVDYRADVEALVKRLAKAIREETAKHSNCQTPGQQN